MPGPRPEHRQTEQGLVVTMPGLRVPGTGGYRAIIARRPLRRLLDDLEPDRLEVSDRTTLRWTGAWARRCGIRSMMVSHDSLAALAAMFRPPGLPVRRLVDRLNRNTAASFDVVVCTTAWAAREFRRLGVPNLVQVPLGVDLAGFHPARADESLRSRLAPGGWWLLVHCSRLSPEKRPERAVGALAELRRRGGARRPGHRGRRPAAPDAAGPGGPAAGPVPGAHRAPRRARATARDRGHGDRPRAGRDLRPVRAGGAGQRHARAGERPQRPAGGHRAGLAAEDNDASCADAIECLLRRDVAEGRRLAREQAERFDWPTAVDGFLRAHGLDRRAAGTLSQTRH